MRKKLDDLGRVMVRTPISRKGYKGSDLRRKPTFFFPALIDSSYYTLLQPHTRYKKLTKMLGRRTMLVVSLSAVLKSALSTATSFGLLLIQNSSAVLAQSTASLDFGVVVSGVITASNAGIFQGEIAGTGTDGTTYVVSDGPSSQSTYIDLS